MCNYELHRWGDHINLDDMEACSTNRGDEKHRQLWSDNMEGGRIILKYTTSSPPRPERLWGPPSLLSKGTRGSFPGGKAGRGVKLTTHLHLVPSRRMSETLRPLPQYAFVAWYSVKKRHRNNFPFPFPLSP
jgi:hypothetical protein